MKRWAGWMYLMMAVAVAGIGIGAVRMGLFASAEDEARAKPGTDSRLVLDYAGRLMGDGYTVSLQHYGIVKERDTARLIKELEREAGLQPLESGNPELMDVYGLADGAGRLTLIRTPGSDRVQELLVLEADAGTADKDGRLLELQGRLAPLMAREAVEGRWSTKVEGTVAAAPGTEEPEETAAGWAGKLLNAETEGVYRENGMVNLTFTSEKLQEKASGADDTALQLALRQDTESGRWMVAVGAPLLTGEF